MPNKIIYVYVILVEATIVYFVEQTINKEQKILCIPTRWRTLDKKKVKVCLENNQTLFIDVK